MNSKFEAAISLMMISKKTYSKYSIMKEFNVLESEIPEFFEILKEKCAGVYVFVICSSCSYLVDVKPYNPDEFGRKCRCFNCKRDFLLSVKDVEFVFEFKTLKEKLS